jgi:hypothetical protein
MPQLNNDGLSRYSANDWHAPVIVFVVPSIYADLIPPTNLRHFRQRTARPTDRRWSVIKAMWGTQVSPSAGRRPQ